MRPDVARLVVLGASNLARGLRTVVSAAVAAWGREVEVLATPGYGRSYGAPSRIGVRILPGILESGLWDELQRGSSMPTRAIVTDVGNDILYGCSAGKILAWIEEAIGRLRKVTWDITITDLPLAGIKGLSRARYLLFRSAFYPRCRLSLVEFLAMAEGVNGGLSALADRYRLSLLRTRPEWYGIDPIHIRRSARSGAWGEVICGPQWQGTPGRTTPVEGIRLSWMAPDRRWLWGIERRSPQTGLRLSSGGRIWCF